MEVQYEASQVIDGVLVDFVLPEQKVLVKLFRRNEVNADNFGLKGTGILNKKILETIPDYKLAFVSIPEFYSMKDPSNKVNYLIAAGIESNNKSG